MTRAYQEIQSSSLGYIQNVVCSTPAAPNVGDMVLVGDLVGFALQDEDANGYTVVDFGPKTLKGSVSAVGANITTGTAIYASVSNGAVVLTNTATGKFVGYALGAVTSGETGTIEFLKEPSITASTALGTGTISSDEIADAAVTKTKLAGGFLKCNMISGGAAGDFTVTGIATTDQIVSVWHVSTAAAVATIADITAEFDITAANTINNTDGTATTDDQLIVFWLDLTA